MRTQILKRVLCTFLFVCVGVVTWAIDYPTETTYYVRVYNLNGDPIKRPDISGFSSNPDVAGYVEGSVNRRGEGEFVIGVGTEPGMATITINIVSDDGAGESIIIDVTVLETDGLYSIQYSYVSGWTFLVVLNTTATNSLPGYPVLTSFLKTNTTRDVQIPLRREKDN